MQNRKRSERRKDPVAVRADYQLRNHSHALTAQEKQIARSAKKVRGSAAVRRNRTRSGDWADDLNQYRRRCVEGSDEDDQDHCHAPPLPTLWSAATYVPQSGAGGCQQARRRRSGSDPGPAPPASSELELPAVSRAVLNELFSSDVGGCLEDDQRRLAGAILTWAVEAAVPLPHRAPPGAPSSATSPAGSARALGCAVQASETLRGGVVGAARCGAVVVPPLPLQLPCAVLGAPSVPSALPLSPPPMPLPSPPPPPHLPLPPPEQQQPPPPPPPPPQQQQQQQQQQPWRMPRPRKMSLSESPLSTATLGLEQCNRPHIVRKLVELLRNCSDRRLTRALRTSTEWAWLSSLRVGAEAIVNTCCTLLCAIIKRHSDLLPATANALTAEAHLITYGVCGAEVAGAPTAVVGVYGLRRLFSLLVQLRMDCHEQHRLQPCTDGSICKELSRGLLCLARAHCAAQRNADLGAAESSASGDINFAAPTARALSTQGEELLECASELVRSAPSLGVILVHRVVNTWRDRHHHCVAQQLFSLRLLRSLLSVAPAPCRRPSGALGATHTKLVRLLSKLVGSAHCTVACEAVGLCSLPSFAMQYVAPCPELYEIVATALHKSSTTHWNALVREQSEAQFDQLLDLR